MVVLTGYKSNSNLNAAKMLSLSEKIRSAVENKWQTIYMDLLSDEINAVADNYVLNRLQIVPGHSILDVSVERVCNRIHMSSSKNVSTRYNFALSLEVMPYKNNWYILVIDKNPYFDGIFKDINTLIPYNVVESETPTENEIVWEEIKQIYSGKSIPFRLNYFPTLPIAIDASKIKFQTKAERALYIAVSDERNAILGSLSMDQAIPPAEIMRYIDEIDLEREAGAFHDYNIRIKTAQLMNILPELSYDLISKPLNANQSLVEEMKGEQVLEDQASCIDAKEENHQDK